MEPAIRTVNTFCFVEIDNNILLAIQQGNLISDTFYAHCYFNRNKIWNGIFFDRKFRSKKKEARSSAFQI